MRVVHYHFRPGGVRRVIELALPFLARDLRPSVSQIVLATSEPIEPAWFRNLQSAVAPVSLTCAAEPALAYLAEQRRSPAVCAKRLRRFFLNLLPAPAHQPSVIWAHNQGLGRNLLLTRELRRACDQPGCQLILHHHDWWFDNRWQRWHEMRKAGFHTLAQAAQVVFGPQTRVRHAAINHADVTLLNKQFAGRSGWLPNIVETRANAAKSSLHPTRDWLRQKLGESAPVWLLPCRLLRRKNVAEALLLTRWLRPNAWLVTTGPISSADETIYSRQLSQAARDHGWKLCLSILHETGSRSSNASSAPSVPALMAASEAVLLTSLQEGFGLPYLEAASAGKPLIARALPNIMPDLHRFGFRFPQAYTELLVHHSLFDWREEVSRQRRLYSSWRSRLPGPCRSLAGEPWLLRDKAVPRPIPFNRLTTSAQMEVLSSPTEKSWELCSPLNPFLRHWRERAQTGRLHSSAWPAKAAKWLSGPAYARRFQQILKSAPRNPTTRASALAVQKDFLRQKLASDNLYPLTWSPQA